MTAVLTSADHQHPAHIPARQVHDVLGRNMLADGMDLVLDLERSRGSVLVDARDGRRYRICSSSTGERSPSRTR